MKKNFIYCVFLAAACIAARMTAIAQTVPKPALWFSFTAGRFLDSDYGSAVAITEDQSISASSSRLGGSSGAVDFSISNAQFLLTADAATENPQRVKLFGYSDNSAPLPGNFTIACWVYVDPSSTVYQKIFFSEKKNSRFALLYHGQDIYLRRTAVDSYTGAVKLFEYYFGAPASFDAGRGWYEVILVMGQRPEDKAKYTKLYVGKPKRVKYDATGPRVVTTTTDALASDFGGAYAFTGVQPFMDDASTKEWGFGNADATDPLHPDMYPVDKLDDFTVWGEALSEAQVKSLVDCQRSQPANLCWQGSTSQQVVARPDTALGLSFVGQEEGITAFPNPTSGALRVRIPATRQSGNGCLRLSDLSGKVLWTKTITTGTAGQLIDLKDIRTIVHAAGIYVLQVVLPGQGRTFKIVVR